MEDQELIYDRIYNSDGLSKAEIKRALKLKDELLQNNLDSLYKRGFIDWEGGKYKAMPEDRIFQLYLERNVDLYYLKDSVDKGLVESLWSREQKGKPRDAKVAHNPGLDGKISELERKMKILESLHKSFTEMSRIR